MIRSFRYVMTILLVFGSFSLVAQRYTDTVTFSQSGGFFNDSFSLSLSCSADHHIRYTINGSTPNSTSTLYTGPIFLDSTLFSPSNIFTILNSPPAIFYLPNDVPRIITLRAAAFDSNDSLVSAVRTNSYLIRALGYDSHGLPLISITADSLDLFDYETGIFVPGVNYDPDNSLQTGNYYQSGSEWERRINIEFYETDNSGINQQCGMRTHGGISRRTSQKGLKIYAREEYGKKRFKHNFFADNDLNSFKHLVLKPFESAWWIWSAKSGIQDYLSLKIAKQLNMESPSATPSVLFINGEYWGIYFLQERPDERFVEDHFNIDVDECNLMSNWYGNEENGSNANFLDLMNFLESADLSNEDDYAHVCERIDVENFIDYYIFEIFIANEDWPANNMRCWQRNNGKFRWIFYDGDACFRDLDYDIIGMATSTENEWPTNPKSTLMFRKLLENEDFTYRFLARFDTLMCHSLSYGVTKPCLDTVTMEVRGEVENQSARFDTPSSLQNWEQCIQRIDDFLLGRVNRIYELLEDVFGYFSSVEETMSIHDISVYPNPSMGELNIKILADKTLAENIALYDITGRQLFASRETIFPGENEIHISMHLAPGLYLVKIGNQTKRIIFQ